MSHGETPTRTLAIVLLEREESVLRWSSLGACGGASAVRRPAMLGSTLATVRLIYGRWYLGKVPQVLQPWRPEEKQACPCPAPRLVVRPLGKRMRFCSPQLRHEATGLDLARQNASQAIVCENTPCAACPHISLDKHARSRLKSRPSSTMQRASTCAIGYRSWACCRRQLYRYREKRAQMSTRIVCQADYLLPVSEKLLDRNPLENLLGRAMHSAAIKF